jgi:hypothetical protein
MKADKIIIERPVIPQPNTQSEDEIAVFVLTRKFIFHQPISQISTEIIPDIAKKRKQTSPLK